MDRGVIAFALSFAMALFLGFSAAPGQDTSAVRRDEPSSRSISDGSANEDIDSLLERIRKRQGVPALAAAVVQGEGTVELGATGLRKARSKHRVTKDDRFHLGSCTKSMTATMCAMLVEQGKLRWNTKVAEVFPDLKEKLDAGFRDVTLEQLLNHRAGLPDDHDPDLSVFPRLLLLDGELPAQRRKMVQIVMGRAPAHEPGSKFAYSNLGFAIAGAMAEAATGRSYEDLMRTLLFEPLGMTTAGFGAPGDAKKVDEPWGHDKMLAWYSPVAPMPGIGADNPPVIAPAGTLHCSLGDWAKYAALHLDAARGRPRLLKADSFKKLHEDSFKQDYAFGWLMVDKEWAGGRILAHDGSNGRWYAAVVIAPEKNIAFLVACNAGSDDAGEACSQTIEALRKREASTSK